MHRQGEKKMGSCLDLRKYQDGSAIEDAFGKILSGKSGYKPIIEKRIDPVKCLKCGMMIVSDKKFCPGCGELVVRKATSIKCSKCNELFEDEDVFCGNCGSKRE